MTDITLDTGQTARIEAGIIQVQSPKPPHHYRMTAQHQDGAVLEARATSYDDAVAFLKQLEPLGYTMRTIARHLGRPRVETSGGR